VKGKIAEGGTVAEYPPGYHANSMMTVISYLMESYRLFYIHVAFAAWNENRKCHNFLMTGIYRLFYYADIFASFFHNYLGGLFL
jgi:hypothetical protein